MKNVRNICGKILLLSLCTVLLLLTGCSAREKKFVLTDENSIEITLVNASDYPARTFKVFLVETQEKFEALQELGRNLEPGEILTIRIPKEENNCYGFESWADEAAAGCNLCLYYATGKYILDGGIIVLPPINYCDEIQTIFGAGTDLETAKETTLAQCQAVHEEKLEAQRAEEEAARIAAEEAKRQEEEAKRQEEEAKRQEEEKWERLENLTQEEADEAVKLLGYDSIEKMRTKRNSVITVSIHEQETQSAFYELYGYWYPNGDRNSLTYIAMTDEMFIWYQFDPEQGDVERGKLRILSSSGGAFQCTFTLSDNNKFTVKRTSLLHTLSQGTFTFENCTKKYSEDAEYYYSKR